MTLINNPKKPRPAIKFPAVDGAVRCENKKCISSHELYLPALYKPEGGKYICRYCDAECRRGPDAKCVDLK